MKPESEWQNRLNFHFNPIIGLLEESKAKRHRRDIDGLRAIAVFAVVAYHAGFLPIHGGYVGVDIFFVISGYLIGAHIYKDVRHNNFSIAAFYRNRAKRILPALFAVLLFCFAMASVLLDSFELRSFGEYAMATVGSASNVLAWLKANYFAAGADQNPLLMTWSLGVEEQFYLIFPLLMLFFGRMGRRRLFFLTGAFTLLSLVLSILGLLIHPTATFYLLPTRAWELSAGIMLAVYEVDRPPEKLYSGGRFANFTGLLGFGLLLFAFLEYTSSTPFPGAAASVPVLGATLILISPSGWINRFLLSSKPFVFLGLISYSWYLWHWPLLSFARIAADHSISKICGTAIAGISLLIAWCSYRFVEQPFRRSTTPAGPMLKKYAILCSLMLLPAALFVVTRGWPKRFPNLTAIEQQSGISHDDPCLVGYRVATPALSTYCIPKTDPRDGVALLGDSHAGALGEALRQMTEAANLKFYEIAKSSCPPLEGVTRSMPSHPGHDRECASFNAEALKIVRYDRTIQTVVLAGFWSGPFIEEASGFRYERVGQSEITTPAESAENLSRGLADEIDIFRSSGKRVIVLKDSPLLTFDPVRRLRLTMIPVRGILARILTPGEDSRGWASGTEIQNRDDEVASAIVDNAARTVATIFDLKKNLCNVGTCVFFDYNRLLYSDPQHLTTVGALRALRSLPIHAMDELPSVHRHSLDPSTN